MTDTIYDSSFNLNIECIDWDVLNSTVECLTYEAYCCCMGLASTRSEVCAGVLKMQDVKMQDMKMTDQIAGRENARH